MCIMSVTYLIFFIAGALGEIEFNSRPRNFSVDLIYYTLIESDQNVAISPFNLWTLMISTAYETAGTTWKEMSDVFLLPEDRLEVVNGYKNLRESVFLNTDAYILYYNFMFYDQYFEINSENIYKLEKDFRFITQRLDFQEPGNAASSAIQTLQEYHLPSRGFIRTDDFVGSSMLMCSYLLFRADWSKKFNYSNTRRIYTPELNNSGETFMMYQNSQFLFSSFESLKATVTELPYGNDGKYCMLLIRPYDGHTVKEVFKNLRQMSIVDIFAKLQSDADEFGLKDVEIELPRCAINSHVILNKPLLDMGVSDMLDPNFSNFDNLGGDKVYISEISHRTLIAFSERETVAHGFVPGYNPIPRELTPVKNPFIFLIMEKPTATVLVGGSYSKTNVLLK